MHYKSIIGGIIYYVIRCAFVCRCPMRCGKVYSRQICSAMCQARKSIGSSSLSGRCALVDGLALVLMAGGELS